VGFFLLRTPLLPLAAVLQAVPDMHGIISTEQAALGDLELRRLAECAHIAEALEVAAPAFATALRQWLDGVRDDQDNRLRGSFVKYLYRMSWRTTPYGLFAGTTVGYVADKTELRLQGRQAYRKHMLVDYGVMTATAAKLAQGIQSFHEVRLRANSSIYLIAGQFRFVEKKIAKAANVMYTLASVAYEPFIEEILEHARDSRSLHELASLLVARGVAVEDARAFLVEMTQADLLQPVCDPPLASDNSLTTWCQRLAEGPDTFGPVRTTLMAVDAAVKEVNCTPVGAQREKTRHLIDVVQQLPGAEDSSYLVDARLIKPAEQMTLGPSVISAIQHGMCGLAIAAAQRNPAGVYISDEMRAFMGRFQERYGQATVPLCEVLDAESGIGYPGAWDSNTSPVPPVAEGAPPGGKWAEQLRRVVWNVTQRGDTELSLTELEWDDRAATRVPVSDAMLVYGRIAAKDAASVDAGKFRVFLMSVAGPSAVAFMGRFCAVDEHLARLVRDQIAREYTNRPTAVVAEVVHLGSGRTGNITVRSRLTDYEIDYLGGSEAVGDYRILVSDLLVSIEGGRVVLRSRRLSREVIPRMSSAYATFQHRNLPVYRFLSAVKNRGAAIDIGWNWGPLEGTPFLPRVTHGRAVLALARWTLNEEDLRPLANRDLHSAEAEWHLLRERMRIPEVFCVRGTEESEMLIDSRTPHGVAFFLGLARNQSQLLLVEQFPHADELCTEGPEGGFVSEFMLPMMKTAARALSEVAPVITESRPQFLPGSEWLYVKLSAGWATLDRVLLSIVAPLIEHHEEHIDSWFFIRYADPEPHLRVRIRGARRALWEKILPNLQALCEPWIDNRSLATVTVDTYAPEIARYGGPHCIELAERLFRIDSDAAVESLEAMTDRADELARRIGVAKSAGQLLYVLLGDDDSRTCARFAAQARDRLLDSMNPADSARRDTLRDCSNAFRAARAQIEVAIGDNAFGEEALQGLTEIAADYRSLAEGGRLSAPLERIIEAFVHMHCNRRFRMRARQQELMVYDWIARWHAGRVARGR
jgi:thiopeptide-type bacteriocin biosynthesis protein